LTRLSAPKKQLLSCKMGGGSIHVAGIVFHKGRRIEWTVECAVAMTELKMALTRAPVLITLDCSENALGIELGIDASTTIGWGAVLSQYKDDGKAHPARYESGIWSDQEKKYDALKLECRRLIKALKKL